MNTLKKELLKLLDKDMEFRYAVAGYLGLSEILKRLDALSEEQVSIRKEQEELRKEQIRLREEQIKLSEEQIKLREEQIRLSEEQIKLREDFNKMLIVMGRMDNRLMRVERTLEKLTVDIEDEAKSILKHRLKSEFDIDIEITSLSLPDLELNIYGVSDNLCVIGEASVRGGVAILNELLNKIEKLKEKYPDKLRKSVITVLYVCLPLPELIEEARKKNVWILKATQDFYKPEALNF